VAHQVERSMWGVSNKVFHEATRHSTTFYIWLSLKIQYESSLKHNDSAISKCAPYLVQNIPEGSRTIVLIFQEDNFGTQNLQYRCLTGSGTHCKTKILQKGSTHCRGAAYLVLQCVANSIPEQ
jgi:hypothetical protein